METSILIAKLYAVVYLVLGIGMLLNAGYFKKAFDEMIKSAGTMIWGGIMALIAGFLMITFHNLWVADWTVIITILGWIAFLKGITLFLAPKAMMKMSKVFFKDAKCVQWMGMFCLIFGLVLGYLALLG